MPDSPDARPGDVQALTQPMTATQPKLMGKLLIETSLGSFLGDRRIRLLSIWPVSGRF